MKIDFEYSARINFDFLDGEKHSIIIRGDNIDSVGKKVIEELSDIISKVEQCESIKDGNRDKRRGKPNEE